MHNWTLKVRCWTFLSRINIVLILFHTTFVSTYFSDIFSSKLASTVKGSRQGDTLAEYDALV